VSEVEKAECLVLRIGVRCLYLDLLTALSSELNWSTRADNEGKSAMIAVHLMTNSGVALLAR
jgi:hypothetical protein